MFSKPVSDNQIVIPPVGHVAMRGLLLTGPGDFLF